MLSTPRSLILPMFGVLCLGLATTPQRMRAQSRDTTHCCTIVRIDAKHGMVTARETATGYTFRVEVGNKRHLAALRIGDKVWANFAARKVRLEAAGDSLCCAIIGTPPPPDRPALLTPYPHSRS